MRIASCRGWLAILGAVALATVGSAQVSVILNRAGGGPGRRAEGPFDIAADADGTVYVACRDSDNALSVTAGGVITEILDNRIASNAVGISFDAAGTVFVSGCSGSEVFRIEPDLSYAEILDSTGDGMGNRLGCPVGNATDAAGNVYVAAGTSNVFRVTPAGDITEIIDSTGDGVSPLLDAYDVKLDGAGNVFVSGFDSHNVFRITPGGVITEIIDPRKTRPDPFQEPEELAVDAAGNVYVAASGSNNAFKITPDGTITKLIGNGGDHLGNLLERPRGIGVDELGNVFVAGFTSDNLFQITTGGDITELVDETGDGIQQLDGAGSVTVDGAGNVYVAGLFSDNVFKVQLPECFLVLGRSSLPGSFAGAGHTWSTHVSEITSSYAVLMEQLPAFPVPLEAPRGKVRRLPTPVGDLHAQILLWNPDVFPTNPEQWSEGLHVTLWSDGTFTSERYDSKNGITIRMEVFEESGERFVRFPFTLAD